ncbi:MAG TPA: glycosyltransferase [Pyrinomonadaceae bacterium]|nr:glycosyltransferase [Pyrinomonadaceae bacterium]
MKTVLIIGADFVPSSLPPATRIRFFASHLPEFGWHPIVLTTKPEFYEGTFDPENEQLLKNDLEVIRVSAFSTRVTRKLGIGDIGLRSLLQQWNALKQICTSRKIDSILIPVPPSISMVLGRMAYRRFMIPYVIDYIDPWVTDSYNRVPKSQRPPKWAFANALSRTVEPYALKHVAHITGVSRGTTDSVIKRYGWLSDERATEIPYGAEAADFDYLRSNPRRQTIFDNQDGYFHISYVGACIPAMHETVRALFEAISLVLQESPAIFSRIRLHFIGTSYAANGNAPKDVQRLAREANIAELVDERPARVSYLESLQLMLDSQALLLLGSNEKHYTASKSFPCILAKRPLLAIFHEASSVIEIMRQTEAGELVTYSDIEGPGQKVGKIKLALERLIINEHSFSQPNMDALRQYSTSAMSARLADCLNSITSIR